MRFSERFAKSLKREIRKENVEIEGNGKSEMREKNRILKIHICTKD